MPGASTNPLFNACGSCGASFDVSAAEPFTKVPCPSCGARVQVRTTFDHFRIIREVGVGGMSRVFEAEDVGLARRVALKILNRECSSDAARLAQFEREARLTASFSHPHIVKVYSVGRDQGYFYIAMELVPGGSLDDRIRLSGAQPEEGILTLAIEMVQGLRVAHGAGLIHRDIKPGNILFSEDDTVKIVDFGLALIQGKDTDEDEELWATPYYVPPEKLYGEPDTFRGDMYSLGASLFHALAGKPPYQKDTNSIDELKKVKSFPVHLRPVAPQVSEETCAIIDRLVSRKPEHRYRSYDELLEHFQFAKKRLRTKEIDALRDRNQRRLVLWGGIAAGVVLAGLIGALVALSGGDDGTNGRGPKVTSEDEGSGTSVTARFLKAREEMLAGHAAKARAAFQQIAEAEGTQQPTLNWALFQTGLCTLLEGDAEAARRTFDRLAVKARDMPADTDPELARFFADAGGTLALPDALPVGEAARFQENGTLRGVTLLAMGLRAWHEGRTDEATTFFRAFRGFTPPENALWIDGCKKLIEPYMHDAKELAAVPKLEASGDAAANEKLAGEMSALIARLKVDGALKRRLEMDLATFKLAAKEAEEKAELARSEEAMRLAAEEDEKIDATLSEIRTLRMGYRFPQAIETLSALQPHSEAARQRVADQLFLWRSAEDFLKMLADDLNARGFSGTLERAAQPPVADATITRASRDKWMVKAGTVERMLEISVVTPAFLVRLAERFVDQTADSDQYYRRREAMVAFAKLFDMDEYARLAGDSLMRESRSFRERWQRIGGTL